MKSTSADRTKIYDDSSYPYYRTGTSLSERRNRDHTASGGVGSDRAVRRFNLINVYIYMIPAIFHFMEFFNSAVDVLQTLVIALGAGLAIWGVINLLGASVRRAH